MNAKQVLFTSVIALSAAGAMADDITIDHTPAASNVTRAQVKAEVLKARQTGALLAAGEGYQGAPAPTRSTLSRAEVKAQVIAARNAGQLLPAGEAYPDSSTAARPPVHASNPFKSLAKVFHRDGGSTVQ